MTDPTVRKIIEDLPRGTSSVSSRKPLTRADIERVLTDTDLSDADRRHWQSRLDALTAAQERQAQANNMTAQEIVDSIPRGIG